MEKLYHGACVYPELWDLEVLQEDIQKMKEVGINVVRLGEFIWSVIEPNEGEIDLSLIKNSLNLFYEAGIDVILCTPTCTPPIWMTYRHPERLYVDQKGSTLIHGSRQHVCTNNEYFRNKSLALIEQIAKEVGEHPALILWQLDNEFKSHQSECCCAGCRELWHEWLEARYGTIEGLNKAFGTLVWSEWYQSFEQVPQPLEHTPYIHNASLSTMYRLFSREKIAEYAHMQADTIRKHSTKPITTNTGMGFALDNEKLYSKLDVVSYDTYAASSNSQAFLINCDLSRGLKRNREFWLMETSTSHGGAITKNPHPHPNGYLVSEAVACYALGGAAFNYWLWRQQPYGCELNHSAVLSAWGTPGIGYDNVLQVEKVRKEIESFMCTTKCAQGELAMTYSDRARAFMLTENHKRNDYRGLMTALYNCILKTGIHRDLTPEGVSLEGYKMLITPFMFYISADYIARAKKFVEEGGIWIIGPMSGGRTAHHTVCTDSGLNKEIEELAGIQVICTYPMDQTGAIGEAFGIQAPLSLWSHHYILKGAQSVGHVIGGVKPGTSFITEHCIGKGKVVILASLPVGQEGEEMIQALVKHYAEEVGITLKEDVPSGVLVVPRFKGNEKYLVYVNMRAQEEKITLKNSMQDVITGEILQDRILNLKGYGYKILKYRE